MFRSVMSDFFEPSAFRHRTFEDPFPFGGFYETPSYSYSYGFPRSFGPRRRAGSSASEQADDTFKVMLNVKHFQPNEIDVKMVDDFVVVHGKHEEQADEHGLVSREFTRRYKLPDDVEPDKVTSSLGKNGVLTIQAPRKVQPLPKNERIVPIIVQQPAAVEAQKDKSEGQQQTEEPKKMEQEQQTEQQPAEEPKKMEQEQQTEQKPAESAK